MKVKVDFDSFKHDTKGYYLVLAQVPFWARLKVLYQGKFFIRIVNIEKYITGGKDLPD